MLAGVSGIAKQVGGISKGESGGSTVAPLNFVVFLFLFLVPHTHDGCDVDGWRDDHNWTKPQGSSGGLLAAHFPIAPV